MFKRFNNFVSFGFYVSSLVFFLLILPFSLSYCVIGCIGVDTFLLYSSFKRLTVFLLLFNSCYNVFVYTFVFSWREVLSDARP